MTDLLDERVTFGGAAARCGATIALHTHEGMIREGHVVTVLVSPGTASHAFGYHEPGGLPLGGMVEYLRRSRGFVQMVEFGAFAADPPSAPMWRHYGHSGFGLAVHTDPLIPLDMPWSATPVELESVAADPPADDTQRMTAMAQAVAATAPAVAVERPQVPELGDEPIENLRRLFDLTYADIGTLFGISERHAHRWHTHGVPAERRSDVDALQAIGLTVIGGLGPAGANEWLRAGTPTGVELVQTGRVAELAQRADAEKDTVFT
jgi:hypothetical protein